MLAHGLANGVFKLAGLTINGLTPRTFERQSVFNPADPKYDGTTLLAVEA